MSLINDALKHTKQVRQDSSPASPPALPPVEPTPPERSGWLLPGIVVLLLVTAGIVFGLSLFKPVPLKARAAPVHHALSVVVPPVTQRIESVAAILPTATNTPSGSNAVAVVLLKPPGPKLQGILFSATRPCAIVSGKTVFVGDFVGRFHVTAILKDSVTLRDETVTKVLSLNPQ